MRVARMPDLRGSSASMYALGSRVEAQALSQALLGDGA